jgi:hypothetical protein
MSFDEFHIILSKYMNIIISTMNDFISISSHEFKSQEISNPLAGWSMKTNGHKTLFKFENVIYKIQRGVSF